MEIVRWLNNLRMHVFISGTVQGVYFRQNTLQKAQELHILGWIRNLKDGRVEAIFEGNDECIEKILSWCKVGPQGAVVKSIEIIPEDYVGEFFDFKILKSV